MPRAMVTNRDRYPSGKLKPDTPPALMRRMIDQARRDASDPRLGSELGRMRLEGILTDTQFLAADQYARLVGRYDRLKGFPARSPKSPSYQIGQGEELSDPDLLSVMGVARARKAADDALLMGGRHALRAVVAVAIDDRSILLDERADLMRGCDLLAEHFRLTGVANRKQKLPQRQAV